MAVALANAELPPAARGTATAIRAAIREVAEWLGDTPAVARSSYIDQRLVSRYQVAGALAGIPSQVAQLPVDPETELAVAALLASADS